MAKDNKKNIIIGVIVAVCIIAIAATIVVISINRNKSVSESNPDTSTSSARVTSQELLEATPSVEITYGDYDGMKTLSKDIQNGRRTGEIISVDGLVNHPGSAYAIVQPSSDGTTKIGTIFILDDSDSYPSDGTRVTVKGKVVEVSPMNFQIVTLKDFVKEN